MLDLVKQFKDGASGLFIAHSPSPSPALVLIRDPLRAVALLKPAQVTTLLLLLLYNNAFKVEFARIIIALYPHMLLKLLELPSPWEAFNKLDSSLDKGEAAPSGTRGPSPTPLRPAAGGW